MGEGGRGVEGLGVIAWLFFFTTRNSIRGAVGPQTLIRGVSGFGAAI